MQHLNYVKVQILFFFNNISAIPNFFFKLSDTLEETDNTAYENKVFELTEDECL